LDSRGPAATLEPTGIGPVALRVVTQGNADLARA
jgi:hypothetical protein